jgi:glycosyltransferase involved in cell wall biosynthesis
MGKQKGRLVVANKKKLFIIADAGVDTGFATVTHNIINHLANRWDISVLAINYYGDPHPIQKKAQLWSPTGVMQGDVYGFNRIKTLLTNTNPDAVLVINDPWVAAEYTDAWKDTPGTKFLYTPIDAQNIKPMFVDKINEGYDYVIGYTQFGIDHLTNAGLMLPSSVIPHGVDKQMYYPLDKRSIRENAGLAQDWFIVQVVDRNQIRKRIDLAMYYFSQWVLMTDKPDSVKFYYHGALIDEGWDLGQLAKSLGIDDRLVLSHRNLNPAHGFPIETMKFVYNIADVKLSTTMGEGWGLTTMESMACGIPNIVPRYSALGEWAEGGVLYTDISDIPMFNTKGINTRGGIPDMASTIRALELLYRNEAERMRIGKAGYDLVTQPRFGWASVAQEFERVFLSATKQENRQ